jgi:aminopeptidase N
VLWDEYKHGKDFADEHNYEDMTGYLFSGSGNKNLVRFYYADKEDVFDAVSYNKGGRILHMLRNFVGDEAFYKALNNYLTTNKFKTGEAQQLRLAFEEVTGKDLNWFWNQWYYGSGQPKLDITYKFDASAHKEFVFVNQTQETDKIFTVPVAIDVYSGKNKERYNVWLRNKADTFAFESAAEPDLVNVDADKTLLCEKVDHKTKENFIFQFKHAPNYLDRREALEYFNANGYPEISLGLQDKYSGLRKWTINHLKVSDFKNNNEVISGIEEIVSAEKDRKTKAAALKFLADLNNHKYLPLFNKNVNDSSYSVSAAALEGITKLNPAQSYEIAKKYSNDAKGDLFNVVLKSLSASGDESDFDFVATGYDEAQAGQEKIGLTSEFCNFLGRVNDLEKIKKGIDYVMKFRNIIPEQYRVYTDVPIKSALNGIAKKKGKEVAEYIQSSFKQ